MLLLLAACCSSEEPGSGEIEELQIEKVGQEPALAPSTSAFSTTASSSAAAEEAAALFGGALVAGGAKESSSNDLKSSRKREGGQEKGRSFCLKLSKTQEQPWGLNLEAVRKGLLYVRDLVGTGAVAEHNRGEAIDGKQILKGDIVHSVNGLKDVGLALKQLQDLDEVTFRVRRPYRSQQSVRKKGTPLGLSLTYHQDGSVLHVSQILDKSAITASGLEVAVGDLVLEVNGKNEGAKAMLDEIAGSEEPVLTIAQVAA